MASIAAETFNKQLDQLFPAPSPAPTKFGLTPARDAGPTYDSEQAVLECLRDNFKKQHIFFNDLQFHNHAVHHLLAIYAMGANRKLLEAAYQTHVLYQRPAFPSPGSIDDKNWKEHLGDENYYQAYLSFFSAKLLAGEGKASLDQVGKILEEYVLSKEANVVPGVAGKPPLMLARYLGGFVHPLIHSGYGAEFGLLGIWAEGLAEAAVQTPDAVNLFTPSLFEPINPSSTGLISQVASLSLFSGDKSKRPSAHALAILAKVAQDPELKPGVIGLPAPGGKDESSFDRVARVCEGKLVKFLEEWGAGTDHGELQNKYEELVWLNVVIYAVAGYAGRNQGGDENKEFNADFFHMHLVTSVLFLPSLMAHLSPQSAALLLRTYFLVCIVLYISRGRPPLPIAEFYSATTEAPLPPGPHPKAATHDFVVPISHTLYDPAASEKAWAKVMDVVTPNPWLAIIQTTLVHPNEHLCKAQRSLAHFAALFGTVAPGHFSFLKGPGGLDGAEHLDGTLFVRAAGLTANRLGWMREGQKERGWDFQGFFDN